MKEYTPLNNLFKNKETYIGSLERQLSFVLEGNWTILAESQADSKGSSTCLELIGPKNVKIQNKFQLAVYCKHKNIDFKKVEFLTFRLYNFHLNSRTYIVKENERAMQRALKRIQAKKHILKQINL